MSQSTIERLIIEKKRELFHYKIEYNQLNDQENLLERNSLRKTIQFYEKNLEIVRDWKFKAKTAKYCDVIQTIIFILIHMCFIYLGYFHRLIWIWIVVEIILFGIPIAIMIISYIHSSQESTYFYCSLSILGTLAINLCVHDPVLILYFIIFTASIPITMKIIPLAFMNIIIWLQFRE